MINGTAIETHVAGSMYPFAEAISRKMDTTDLLKQI
jgi:hypothetical protein